MVTKYINALLQIIEPPKRPLHWGEYADILLGTIQYSLSSLNNSLINPVHFPGFDGVLERVSENSFIRREFLSADKSTFDAVMKNLLPIRNALLILAEYFVNAQAFPASVPIERILLLLRNVHSYLLSILV